MDEKSYLQSIKLEISKNVKLEPYERIAFHKLLGLHRSEAGINTLFLELKKTPLIRRSSLNILSRFDRHEAVTALIPLLFTSVSSAEKALILDAVRERGESGDVPELIRFIDSIKANPEARRLQQKAFQALARLGAGKADVFDYLLGVLKSDEVDREIKILSIRVLSSFKSIAIYEELLKKDDDAISLQVYRSLYTLIGIVADARVAVDSEEERLYTYNPDSEDKIILDIRVLLGKMAPRFDGYTNLTKIAFISAMMACGHREFLIYTMKALTSKDQNLITMVLYALYRNITIIRDPDKLFKSLISISSETERDSDLIVSILVKYFKTPKNTRQYHLLQDKMFSYIIVTLETYFETYRKEFMITDVIEKSLPESFQVIRVFMLERLSPELKKKITAFLLHDDATMISHIISDLSQWLAYVDENERPALTNLLDMLSDKDRKSRENSAARVEDLNYEKRYLRDRILRVCRIIEELDIKDAASVLVNIYNYLKKYTDEKLIGVVARVLSSLNYSYMLGEIEVMLSAGSEAEKIYAVQLISRFTEQRSLNIIFEILQARIEENSPLVKQALDVLKERDIKGNGTASQILKAIIERNGSKDIRCAAILCLGKCCFDSDIDFLHGVFFNKNRDESKDEIVRAIGEIAVNAMTSNKRQLIKSLQDYLKDPGIKVRIYSCVLLAHLGYKEANRAIRDMMVIKNKDIQRDMLTIMSNLKSLDFGFFLISLLTGEYAITEDIVRVLSTFSPEDIKEIDAFVVNMFQKYERPDIETLSPQPEQKEAPLHGLKESEITLLHIDIAPYAQWKADSIPDIIFIILWIREHIIANITKCGGVIASMSSTNIVAVFHEPLATVNCAMAIIARVKEYNRHKAPDRLFHVVQQVVTGTARLINDELLETIDFTMIGGMDHPFMDRIVVNAAALEKIKGNYTSRRVPEIVLSRNEVDDRYEILSSINFIEVADDIIRSIAKDEEKKQEMQQKIEAEIKKLKLQSRSTSSVAIARDLDTIGMKLQELLDEIDRYVQKRSTDRELIRNVTKLLANVYNLYKVEISRIIIE